MRKLGLIAFIIWSFSLLSLAQGVDAGVSVKKKTPVKVQKKATVVKKQPVKNIKSGIRSVDFANFTYDDIDGNRVKLSKGKTLIKGEYSTGKYGSTLNAVKYVDFDGNGSEEALVVIDYSQEAAGVYYVQVYLVYAYENNSANLIFQTSRYKSNGFNLKGNSLIITAPFWADDDGHCCPSKLETATYRWKGNGIKLISQKFAPFE